MGQFVHYFSRCLHIWGTLKGLLNIWKAVSVKEAACKWLANENNLVKARKMLECETLAFSMLIVYCVCKSQHFHTT